MLHTATRDGVHVRTPGAVGKISDTLSVKFRVEQGPLVEAAAAVE
eukprot:gene12368-9404_t